MSLIMDDTLHWNRSEVKVTGFVNVRSEMP